MTDWLNISTQQAMLSLRQNLVVYGAEAPDGEWGQVLAIEELLEQGLRTAVYRIRFASGDVRFGPADGGFRVEQLPAGRDSKAAPSAPTAKRGRRPW